VFATNCPPPFLLLLIFYTIIIIIILLLLYTTVLKEKSQFTPSYYFPVLLFFVFLIFCSLLLRLLFLAEVRLASRLSTCINTGIRSSKSSTRSERSRQEIDCNFSVLLPDTVCTYILIEYIKPNIKYKYIK
jgi:hypothetical protein